MMSILKKLFLYTSRFVTREAVSKLFVLDSGRDYQAFKDEVLSQPDERRIDGLDDFIFGIDDAAVRQRISQVVGLYLFVDYSVIRSTLNSVDVKTDFFHVAITVAHPTPEDHDQATELLWQDRALDVLSQIRRQMRDDIDSPDIAWMEFPTTVQPLVAHSLANSIGWVMEFDVKGIDVV